MENGSSTPTLTVTLTFEADGRLTSVDTESETVLRTTEWRWRQEEGRIRAIGPGGSQAEFEWQGDALVGLTESGKRTTDVFRRIK